MAHRLVPPGQALSPAAVVERLRNEFGWVESDPERGRDHVGDMLAAYRRMRDGGRIPVPDSLIDDLAPKQDHAIWVHVADDEFDEDAFFETVILPDEPLFIGYSSGEHQDAAASLVARCAAVLGYELVLV
jgi:hypothetical protein